LAFFPEIFMGPFFLHPSNQEIMGKILELVDTNGKPALSPTQKDILLMIGRFDKDTGNFMSMSNLLKDIGRMTGKTLTRHLEYLHFIGVIDIRNEVTESANGRPRLTKIRRLRDPEPGPVMSYTEYNARVKKEPSYKYAAKKFPIEDDIFFEALTNLSSDEGQFIPKPGDNLSTSIGKREDMKKKKRKKDAPPKFPPQNDQTSAARTTMDGLDGRPLSEDEPRARQSKNSSEEKGGLPGEPLVRKKRGKKKKTQRERVAEANAARAKGHLVPPLGKKENRGRKLKPSLARDIGESGSVTISQLWKAYCQIFSEAFGLENLLPSLISEYQENITRHFDEMRQRMLDVSGYEPSYRDIYEYLKWFHDAKRLKSLLQAGTKTGDRGYVHPNQLLGKVHLRKFYDQVLSRGKKTNDTSERVSSQREMTQFVQDAYDHIRRAQGNNLEVAYCIVNYGYVIFAEWLKDYSGCNGSACKKRIIEVFRLYVESSDDADAALDFLSDAWANTEENSSLFTSDVWEDWKGTCTDIMSLIKDEQH
jgi:hypothetical protein